MCSEGDFSSSSFESEGSTVDSSFESSSADAGFEADENIGKAGADLSEANDNLGEADSSKINAQANENLGELAKQKVEIGDDQSASSTEKTEISDDTGEASSVKYSDSSDNTEADSELSNSPERHNCQPDEDIKKAFEYVDSRYPTESATWQETAQRRCESLYNQEQELRNSYSEMEETRSSMEQQIRQGQESGLNNTPEFAQLCRDYQGCTLEMSRVSSEFRDLDAQRLDIAKDIDKDNLTSFSGYDGADFESAYDSFNTDVQGSADRSVDGDCGIIESVNMSNQQLGENLGELDGIEQFRESGLCESDGGTSFEDREEYFTERGLSYDVEFGEADTGQPIDLDDVAERFNSGESCGIILKAEDLQQEDLSDRNNIEDYSSDHATTVAGFSYDSNGEVTGVWVNDTGNWTDSNRVFISRSKFDSMQKETVGFGVEYAKKSGGNSYVKKM